MKSKQTLTVALVLVFLMALAVGISQAQGPEGGVSALADVGTGITYQGQLQDSVGPVNDTCSFQFSLYDAATSGVQIGTTQTKTGVDVTDGYFTIADLDFGSGAFNGEARWLEIAIQCTGEAGYTSISPLQELKPVPYALALPGLRTEQVTYTPNLIGGNTNNNVTAGVYAATIGGGGSSTSPNLVTDYYGTVCGGRANIAGNDGGTLNDAGSATVGGGYQNQASGFYSIVGGGRTNEAGSAYAAICGGRQNDAMGQYATIGGGYLNATSSNYAAIGGGEQNQANAQYSTVGGGYQNVVTDTYSTIGGGDGNVVGHQYVFIGGGMGNEARGQYSTIAGGRINDVIGDHATIGGGGQNDANGIYSTVPGGVNNLAAGDYSFAGGQGATAGHNGAFVWADATAASAASTVNNQFLVLASGGVVFTSTNGAMLRLDHDGNSPNIVGGHTDNVAAAGAYGVTIGGGGTGGGYNRVSDNYGTIGGGTGNTAGDGDGIPTDATYATVGGGWGNVARSYATVGGGSSHQATGPSSTIAGGASNTASGSGATVGGGASNTASQTYATVSGGHDNTAGSDSAVVGGGSWNSASGQHATIPGGNNNSADGDYSFAAGRNAHANHDGAFVWGDGTLSAVSSSAANQFIVQAGGGVTMYTSSNLSSGVYLAPGAGSWSGLSDRAAKANLSPVNGYDVLARLAEVPIATWNYTAQASSVRHMGPMAQDFYAAFGLGESERHISNVDADGVALAAIQGLHGLVLERDARIEELESENAALARRLDDLDARMAALETGTTPRVLPLRMGMLPGAGALALCLGLVWLNRRGGDFCLRGGRR